MVDNVGGLLVPLFVHTLNLFIIIIRIIIIMIIIIIIKAFHFRLEKLSSSPSGPLSTSAFVAFLGMTIKGQYN